MKLVWKLLRQHISIPQFAGFFFANLIGMLIILLGVQFYNDIQNVYDSEDSLMKSDYIILNKKVGTLGSIIGKSGSFSEDEIDDIEDQDFTKKVGLFTPSNYNVRASFDIEGFSKFSTEMFFESVPDEFVDVKSEQWGYKEGETTIPIVLPKNYLDLYNFGFAQSRSLPKLSAGILGAIKLRIQIAGNGHVENFDGRIAGFSSRLNTILVPQAFMQWANEHFSSGNDKEAQRIILEVDNPADEAINAFIQDHNYETDTDKLQASKTNYVLKVIIGIVMSVGLLISILSFYILMLSVYLLVQKNTIKLQNLLLLGYSPAKVSMPYQLLTVGLNVLVFALAWVLLVVVRQIYLAMLESFFPGMERPSMMMALGVGVALLLIVSIFNVVAVRSKITGIWRQKE